MVKRVRRGADAWNARGVPTRVPTSDLAGINGPARESNSPRLAEPLPRDRRLVALSPMAASIPSVWLHQYRRLCIRFATDSE
jgi:hypothetical protein